MIDTALFVALLCFVLILDGSLQETSAMYTVSQCMP